jgi:serine/threonine-protein kinase
VSGVEPQTEHGGAGALAALEALFHQAMQLPAERRPSWADEQLADDPAQAQLLKRMLEHAEDDATGLGQAVGEFARAAAAPRDRSGERIGRYSLVERIRFGGMAEVYRAVRADGEFELDVALKVVRSDRVRPELNALFAAERALMARLNHPNIIQIYDGGTTVQGEAWFVMELLDGLPLPVAISHHGLAGDRVLGHLLELCAAINHAHGQLVVHRDIKPENVLLCRTAQGWSIRLIDFGIASALSSGVTAMAKGEGAWHSPGYSAPEARNGLAHGATADVYSLGRLLLDCVDHLPARYRKELRAIGEKASREDPAQRYSGVASLAEDLERMRRREPISLFRQRGLHVLQRALERHRWAATGALLALVAASAWLWRETSLRLAAEQATARAQVERDRAEAMRDFLLRAFDSGNPSLNRGEEPRISELIVGQLDLLESDSRLDPDSHIQLLGSFGDLLLHLDRRDLADHTYARATGLIEAQGASGDLRWVRMLSRRGQIASRDGRIEDAGQWFEQAGTALEHLPDSLERTREMAGLYSAWGASAQRSGKLDEAERLIRIGLSAKQILKAAKDPDGDDSALWVTLGAIQSARNDLSGALETFEAAYAAHRAAGHRNTLQHLALLGWLGITLDRLGRAGDGEPYLLEAVAVAEKLYPEPHSKLSGSYANLGRLYLNQGRLAEAAPLLDRALEVSEGAGESGTPDHAVRLSGVGLLALESERYADALGYFEQAAAMSEATLGKSHRRTVAMRLVLIAARAEIRPDASQVAYVDSLLADIGQAPQRTDALLLGARLAAGLGQISKATALLDEARERMGSGDPIAPATPHQQYLLGRALEALQQDEAARRAFLESASAYAALGQERHPGRGRALLQAALLMPPGSPERTRIGAEARQILEIHLQSPAASLAQLALL